MSKYDKMAGKLQSAVEIEEAGRHYDYTKDDVYRSTVHARSDLVLVVSYLSSINKQLLWIRIALIILLVILIWGIFFK